METSKPFLVKNILEMSDDAAEGEDQEKNIKNDQAEESEDTKTANLETYGEDDRASQVSDEQQESTQEATGNPLNRRKVRRCFRAEQLEYLERCFMEAIYPEASMRKRIAQELKVSNDRVQVWFQNRRAKARKQWKQQYCSSPLSRISPPTAAKPPLRPDLHLRFANPFSQFGQLRREFHFRRFDRRNSMVAIPPFEEHRAQPPPPMPMCSCCPVPRSMAHFKPYEPRLSHSPTPPVPQRHCHCLPLRPRPNCMP